MVQVYLGSLLHLSVIPRVNRTGQPCRQCTARGRTQCSLSDRCTTQQAWICLPRSCFLSVLFSQWSIALVPSYYLYCVSDFVHVLFLILSFPSAHCLLPSFTPLYLLKSLVGSPDWAVDCVCAHQDQSEVLELSLSALFQNQTLLTWIRPNTLLCLTCSTGHHWRTVALLSHSKWIHSQLWGLLQDSHGFAGRPDPTPYC